MVQAAADIAKTRVTLASSRLTLRCTLHLFREPDRHQESLDKDANGRSRRPHGLAALKPKGSKCSDYIWFFEDFPLKHARS
jgi:hypothetical protein